MRLALPVSVLALAFSIGAYGQTPQGETEMERRFKELYEKVRAAPPSLSSNPSQVWEDSPELRALASLGPRCLPYLMDAIREGGGNNYALLMVASKILRVEPGPLTASLESVYKEWIESKLRFGYAEARTEFVVLRKEWLVERERSGTLELWRDIITLEPESGVLRTRRETTDLGKIYCRIEALGLFVLPALVHDIAAGNYDFLPIMFSLTDGKALARGGGTIERSARSLLGWWQDHKSSWLVPSG